MAKIKSGFEKLPGITVRVTVPKSFGTGFLIREKEIVTCQHVVKKYQAHEIIVEIDQQEIAVAKVILPTDPECDLAVLILEVPISISKKSLIGFNFSIAPLDHLISFGYSDMDRHGAPTTYVADGMTGGRNPMIKFSSGIVRAGMSGAPLLNLRTEKICGVVKYSDSASLPIGGGAIPILRLIEQFDTINLTDKVHRIRKQRMLNLSTVERYTSNRKFIYVTPVKTEEQHASQWRWNQRMYKHRYPAAFDSFDMIGLELGRSWWQQYRPQDWAVRDWNHNQIGSYCLCPITKEAFQKIEKGKLIESELTPADIIPENLVSSHKYWYCASIIKAKVKDGVRRTLNDYVLNIMIAHALSRAIWHKDFASASGDEIVVVGFVESPTIRKFAQRYGFHRAIPRTHDPSLEKIYISDWSRDALINRLQEAIAIISTLDIGLFNRAEKLFQQPPDF